MSLLSLAIFLDLAGKASVILAGTALIAAALRRASASTRHFVWTLGLLSALVAPALTLAIPRWEVPIVRVAASTLSPVENPAVSPRAAALAAKAQPDLQPSEATSPVSAPATSEPRAALPSWPIIALMVWAVGASLVLARMLVGFIAVQWMSRRTAVVTDAPWLRDAQALAGEFGLRRVRFVRGGAGTMPMAWGIFQSSVVMPADADAWPADRVRVVLLHELAHVKRHDCLTHVLAQIACAVYWFNPLAWIAAKRLRSERERACDDLVLAAGTRGSDYADQLLDIARVMNAGRFPAVLAGASLAMAKPSQLEGRLIAILDPSVARRGMSRARAAAAVVTFAVVMMAVASVQPWAEERVALQGPDRPVESYPGQAAADVRKNAAQQPVIQDTVQGSIQGTIQGAVQGGIQGGIHGGVQGGVHGGTARGVIGSIVDSVAPGIASVVTEAVADVAEEVAREIEHEAKKEHAQTRGRDPRAVNALLEALKDSDKDVRETAMNALVQMRDPRMFEPLVAALKDASADVREHAAFGLGQLRDARAIDPLASVLKDQSASVREQAVFALGQLRAAAAVEAISIALRDSSTSVREQAAFALGQIRDRKSVDALIPALKDENPGVREQAAFALGQMRDVRAVEALVVALKDSNPGVREQVAFALGQIGDARAIDGLTAALKDTNPDVRQQAAFALGQIR
jgi:HEAT repeat protein/beta-lactamase regulating signal transducer with metallopeptidase domain